MKKVLKDLVVFCILAIIIAGIILPRELNNLDEIWNFNFARNIANGLVPYKDFNMVQTPLLSIVCGMILKVFGTELFIMRILAIILCSLILFVSCKLLEKLKITKGLINLFLIITIYLYKEHFCIDYNFVVLLILLLIILIELHNNKEQTTNKKINFTVGILAGMAILTKQTTGIFLAVVALLYKILIINNKEELKLYYEELKYKVIGIIIPIALFCLYITIYDNWNHFIDYTILGIKTFSNKISYLNLIRGNYGMTIAILSVLVPITIVTMYVISICKKIETEEQKNIFVLFAYSVASFVVVYPISDSIHFLIGAFPTIIAMVYFVLLFVKKLLKRKLNRKIIDFLNNFVKCLSFLSTLVIVIYSIFIIAMYIKTCSKYTDISNFKYIPASSEHIQIIDDFILEQNEQGKEVYILDATAALYMIPLNKYNKDYDMFLKGNLGRKR